MSTPQRIGHPRRRFDIIAKFGELLRPRRPIAAQVTLRTTELGEARGCSRFASGKVNPSALGSDTVVCRGGTGYDDAHRAGRPGCRSVSLPWDVERYPLWSAGLEAIWAGPLLPMPALLSARSRQSERGSILSPAAAGRFDSPLRRPKLAGMLIERLRRGLPPTERASLSPACHPQEVRKEGGKPN
jgi:hypothetical protein